MKKHFQKLCRQNKTPTIAPSTMAVNPRLKRKPGHKRPPSPSVCTPSDKRHCTSNSTESSPAIELDRSLDDAPNNSLDGHSTIDRRDDEGYKNMNTSETDDFSNDCSDVNHSNIGVETESVHDVNKNSFSPSALNPPNLEKNFVDFRLTLGGTETCSGGLLKAPENRISSNTNRDLISTIPGCPGLSPNDPEHTLRNGNNLIQSDVIRPWYVNRVQ